MIDPADTKAVQEGTATAARDGLLTIEMVVLYKTPHRLIIVPAAQVGATLQKRPARISGPTRRGAGIAVFVDARRQGRRPRNGDRLGLEPTRMADSHRNQAALCCGLG